MSAGATPAPDAVEHLSLVETVGRKMARSLPDHVSVDDLISAGYIGLLDAVRRFDPARGARFTTYAEHRIRGAILDDMRGRDTLSRDMRRVLNEIREAAQALETQLGRAPDEEEI